jgi:hypothetical protein
MVADQLSFSIITLSSSLFITVFWRIRANKGLNESRERLFSQTRHSFEKRIRNERLICDPNSTAQSSRDESHKACAAAKFYDGLVLHKVGSATDKIRSKHLRTMRGL